MRVSERIIALRTSTLAGQGVRFVAAGGFVSLVYIATTSLLAEVIGLPFELALAIGFAVAITTHFTLQRVFVWTHEHGYALSLRSQVTRYLIVAGIQYGITAAITATVPHAIGVSTEIVYLFAAALLTLTTFIVLRSRVFHPNEHAIV
jgi:putative flippase GtrA